MGTRKPLFLSQEPREDEINQSPMSLVERLSHELNNSTNDTAIRIQETGIIEELQKAANQHIPLVKTQKQEILNLFTAFKPANSEAATAQQAYILGFRSIRDEREFTINGRRVTFESSPNDIILTDAQKVKQAAIKEKFKDLDKTVVDILTLSDYQIDAITDQLRNDCISQVALKRTKAAEHTAALTALVQQDCAAIAQPLSDEVANAKGLNQEERAFHNQIRASVMQALIPQMLPRMINAQVDEELFTVVASSSNSNNNYSM